MKSFILFSMLILGSSAFAADVRDNGGTCGACFQTKSCDQPVGDCYITYDFSGDSGTGLVIAGFDYRENIQHGCATNAGTQYIWEQGEVATWAATDMVKGATPAAAKAEALKQCNKVLSDLKNSQNVCK